MSATKQKVKVKAVKAPVSLTLLDGSTIEIVGAINAVSSKKEVLLPEDGTFETHIFSIVYTSAGQFTVKETSAQIIKLIG